MALHFSRVGRATAELEIWSASEGGFSFVISNESSSGPGLRGRPGFAASWRPIHINRSGWADHPSRRSPKPRGLVRPCWNICLDRFSFGAPLALAGGYQAFVSHLNSENRVVFPILSAQPALHPPGSNDRDDALYTLAGPGRTKLNS